MGALDAAYHALTRVRPAFRVPAMPETGSEIWPVLSRCGADAHSRAIQGGYAAVILGALVTLISLAWPVIQTMETTFPKARIRAPRCCSVSVAHGRRHAKRALTRAAALCQQK